MKPEIKILKRLRRRLMRAAKRMEVIVTASAQERLYTRASHMDAVRKGIVRAVEYLDLFVEEVAPPPGNARPGARVYAGQLRHAARLVKQNGGRTAAKRTSKQK